MAKNIKSIISVAFVNLISLPVSWVFVVVIPIVCRDVMKPTRLRDCLSREMTKPLKVAIIAYGTYIRMRNAIMSVAFSFSSVI